MERKLAVAILLLLLISCQNASDKKERPEGEFTNEHHAFFSNLMAPAQAAAQVQSTGAEFNANLLSDPQDFPLYTRNPVKAAANLGVYLSDFNYSVAYRDTTLARAYFIAVQQLSRAMGAERETLDFLIKRYNENIQDNDSIRIIIADLLKTATSLSQGKTRENLAGIAMAAYQIENLHLVLGTIRSSPAVVHATDSSAGSMIPLLELALRQEVIVENIYGFLKSITDPTDPERNPNFLYYTKGFEELIAVYKKLNTAERILNHQTFELIHDPAWDELIQKTEVIRSKIISLE